MNSFQCAQGHQWLADAADRDCPTCGSPVMKMDADLTFSKADGEGNPNASGASEEQATWPSRSPAPEIPPTVPGFKIERELGRGGMGVVYLARQIELNRPVALKMILSGLHAGPSELARFRTEARAAAQLQHPNIVQIYEVGEAEGRPYLALEYVPGGSLAAWLTGQPWSPRDAARLVETLARAIQHAHVRGVIHRDLKPANILLASEPTHLGSEGPRTSSALLRPLIPKITDFGLAKHLSDSERPAGPTRTGAVVGTPSYIAPEQASGKARGVGPAADVYSLGAILYELLTGRPPFRGETPLDTVLQVVADDPVPPRRLQPKVPRDLETICLKCLEKEPRKRYASALDLAEDLHRFREGRPILARPSSVGQRAWKWAKRKPALTLLILGAIGAVVAGFAISVKVNVELQAAAQRERDLARQADQQRHIADAERQRAFEETLRAEDLRRQAQLEAMLARRSNYALQLAQAFTLSERDPLQATILLDDARRCPPELRDFTWGYLRRLCRRERPPLQGHLISVSALAFAPDGSWLASAGWDRAVRLWQPRLGNAPWASLTLHDGLITSMAVHPNGRLLATASDDHTVRLWRVTRPWLGNPTAGPWLLPWPMLQEEALLPLPHSHGARSVAFSPDGKRLATGGYEGSIRLWDVATWREIASAHGHESEVWALAFTPDGQILASGGQDRQIHLWDMKRAEESPDDFRWHTLRGHDDAVTALAFSPDGKTLASGGGFDDQSLRLWDVARRKERYRLRGHIRAVYAVAFAPDGQAVATGSADGTIRLWDPTTGRQRTVLHGHPAQIHALAFSPDSRLLVSGGADRVIRLWDLDEHREDTRRLNLSGLGLLRLTPDASLVVFADQAGVQRWEGNDAPPRPLADAQIAVDLLAVASQVVAAVDRNGTVRFWREDQPPRVLASLSRREIRSLAVAPNGQWVVLGLQNGLVRVIPTTNGDAPFFLPGRHRGPVTALAISPDARTIASGGDDRLIQLWTQGRQQILRGAGHPIRSLAFSPDGSRLASGSLGGVVRLWDLQTEKSLTDYSGHTDTVTCLVFSPDGLTLASGSEDRTIKLWDAQTGHERLSLAGHTETLADLAFAPDGSLLASVSIAGVLKIWRADPRPTTVAIPSVLIGEKTMPLSCTQAATDEYVEALELLFSHLSPEERTGPIFFGLMLLSQTETDVRTPVSMFTMRQGDTLCGAVMTQVRYGGVGVIWPPRAPDRSDLEDQLLRTALSWLHQQGVHLVYSTLRRADVALAEPLQRGGFSRPTQLIILDRPTESIVSDPLCARYEESCRAEFESALSTCLSNSLDFPELNSRRSIKEVLEGFQAAGSSPEHWWILREQGRLVGVLMLAPGHDDWEITYMGVVPEARRRGHARMLLRHASGEAHRHGAGSLTVCVEARNQPALRLYQTVGFQEREREDVYLYCWPS